MLQKFLAAFAFNIVSGVLAIDLFHSGLHVGWVWLMGALSGAITIALFTRSK